MKDKRQKIKGRRSKPPFCMLPHHILDSEEYARLSTRAVKLLIDLLAQYRGKNNGDLCAAWSRMEPRGWNSKDTLNNALKELERSGFILRTRQGGRNKASLFAITWNPIDDCDGKLDVPEMKVPPNLWKNKTCSPNSGSN